LSVTDLPSGPPTPLGAAPVNAAAAYPPGVAVLDVTSLVDDAGERFALTGRCCCADLPYTAPTQQRRPNKVDVAALITKNGGESPAQTFLRLKNWSTSKVALQRWLNLLRSHHRDDLAVIIRDNTDFAIPWELFWVDDGDGGGDWLGSLATLTRWTTMVRADPDIEFLPRPALRKDGGVLAYIAGGPMQADMETMARLEAVVKKSLWDMLDELKEPGDPLALIYAACHGTFRESTTEFVLDGEVSVADVDTAPLRRLRRGGGLVFVNACNSARLMYDMQYNDATLRGFAEAFMRAGAAGFLGTNGTVSESQARSYLVQLVGQLVGNPGMPVAVAIRNMRRDCAVRTPPRSTDSEAARALLPFFYTFMYAYFGSPDSIVELPQATDLLT